MARMPSMCELEAYQGFSRKPLHPSQDPRAKARQLYVGHTRKYPWLSNLDLATTRYDP